MSSTIAKTFASCLMLAAVAACSNTENDGPVSIGRQAIGQVMGQIGGAKAPAPAPRDPAAIAADALAANPGPLILVEIDGNMRSQPMAMTGQNGRMRTYMTPSEQAIILRDGMLVGTKGLGHDLSVAEADGSAALIRSGRSGTAQRVMRYISGDGVERPLPLNCDVQRGASQSLAVGGRNWNLQQMVESCEGQGLKVQNTYLVSSDGQIPVSRQWIGQALGYVTIQTIRP